MIVEIDSLAVRYQAGTETYTAVDIPSWHVEEGEQVAVSGPSGSGKSTLLHVLAGLLPATEGSVRVCGEDLSRLGEVGRDRFRARHVGYIFQTFNLLQGYTALENVMLGMVFSGASGRRTLKGTARRLLEEVGLGHRLDYYPSLMSIGEQQRVAIARALAKGPELMLADEPTGSLDPRRAAGVISLLKDACRSRGCTLVLVSHEEPVVSSFSRRVDFLELNHALGVEGGGG